MSADCVTVTHNLTVTTTTERYFYLANTVDCNRLATRTTGTQSNRRNQEQRGVRSDPLCFRLPAVVVVYKDTISFNKKEKKKKLEETSHFNLRKQ